MSRVTVVCSLARSNDYDEAYVLRLQEGIRKHTQGHVTFLCVSDTPVDNCWIVPSRYSFPGWWSKMELFRPDLPVGDVLIVDLDTIPCGDLTEILAVDRLTMLSDFFYPAKLASGLMYIPDHHKADVWHHFLNAPRRHIESHAAGGDGSFLTECFAHLKVDRWQDVLPGQVVSYKAHVRDQKTPADVETGRAACTGDGHVPANARVVCFHGKPRPRELGWQLPAQKKAKVA